MCGAPVSPDAQFCGNCGGRQSDAQSAPSQPLPSQPAFQPPSPPLTEAAPQARKAGGAGKFILIGCGVLALLGVLSAAALYFLTYKFKQKAESIASEMKLGSDGASYGPALTRKADVCELLSKEELTRLAGINVTRVESEENSCQYFAEGAQAAEMGEKAAEEALEKLKGAQPQNSDEARALIEQLGKGMAAAQGSASAGGERLVLKVTVNWGQASTLEPAYKIAMKAMTAGLPDAKYSEELKSVGDRAYSGPMGMGLFVVKGDAWIEVAMPGASSRDVLLETARKVVSRL